MRILFTADWHIKLSQKNIPTEWAVNRYELLVEKINVISDKLSVNKHIIGGDIFDRVPTLEELSLFFRLIQKLEAPAILYDGNHEATKKGETFLKLLAPTIKLLRPDFYVCPRMEHFPGFDVIPYCDLKNFDKGLIPDAARNKLLFTHVRGNIPPHVTAEIPLEKFKQWELVIAGDLHSHSNSQENIVYPGSPLTTSFHRSPVECGGIVIDTDSLKWEFISFGLPQLLRKTITNPDEAVPTDYDLTIYELEGNIEDLSKVEDNQLIDKKITKRVSEAALLLSPNMTIEDEISEYLKYILGIEEDKVKELLKLFHDSTKGSGLE